MMEWIIVFVSITAAFMLENWSDARRDKKMLSEYYKSLVIDIDSDIATLDSCINNIENKLTGYAKIVEFIKSKSPNDSIYKYMDVILGSEQFNSNKSTFESLINSGNVNLISKIDLKKELYRVYGLYDDVELIDKVNYDQLFNNVLPFLYQSTNLITLEDLDKSISSRGFANIIVVGKGFNETQLESYRELKDALTVLLADIKKEMK
jgi:hypothetical protein